MKVEIYHANKALFRDSMDYGMGGPRMEELIVHYNNGSYKVAGVVEAADLEDAYMLSQNGHGDWEKFSARSTCIGDIFKVDGDVYLVGQFGFDQIKKGA